MTKARVVKSGPLVIPKSEHKSWEFCPNRAAELVLGCQQRFPLERVINTYLLIYWALSDGTRVRQLARALALHITLTKTKGAKTIGPNADPYFLATDFGFLKLPDRFEMPWFKAFNVNFLSRIGKLSAALEAPSLKSYNGVVGQWIRDNKGPLAIAEYLEKSVEYNPRLVATRSGVQKAFVSNALQLKSNYFRPVGPKRKVVEGVLGKKAFDSMWDNAPATLLLASSIVKSLKALDFIEGENRVNIFGNREFLVRLQVRKGRVQTELRNAVLRYNSITTECLRQNREVSQFRNWRPIEINISKQPRLSTFNANQIKVVNTIFPSIKRTGAVVRDVQK